MAEVLLIAGTRRSGRVARIDSLLREAWGRALLLAPTRQYAARRLEGLIAANSLPGVWGRPVSAMDDFVAALLTAEGIDPVRLADFERRLLFKQVIEGLQSSDVMKALGTAARTQGFLSHAMRTVTQLKQAAIEPAAFAARAAQRKHGTPMDAVVATVYARYQDALRESGAYDLPGLYWQADLAVRARDPAVLDGIDTLILDGFDDFTPSEFRLIASLEQRVNHLVFGINYDPDPDRRDLFRLTHGTMRAVAEGFDARVETYEEETPRTCIDFASRHFMHRGLPSVPADATRDAAFWMCADIAQEMEAIARGAKALLLDGTPADTIAVVYPDLRHHIPLVRRVFAEYGVPIHLLRPSPLWASAVTSFLFAWFDALSTWSHPAVLDVLASPWFLGGAPECASFARLAAMAQVIAGRAEWFQGADRLLARIEADKGEEVRRLITAMPDAASALRRLQERLRALGAMADDTPEHALPAAWPGWLDGMIDTLEIPATIESHPVAAIRDYERAALAAWRTLLGGWAVRMASQNRPQPRADFVAELRATLQQAVFAAPGDRHGVAILDLAALRGMQFDHVFLAGANEGNLPAPPAANAIYSEEDVQDLAAVEIRLEGRSVHADREVASFHRVFDAARRHLTLSWRVWGRGGKEQPPSPYLDEVRALLEPVTGAPIAQGGFIPHARAAASWRDLCNLASTDVPELQGPVARCFPWVEAGIRIERARGDHTPFGPHDGILGSAATAGSYDAQHVFSVAQLETYADCPFRFFVQRLLDIDETEMPKAEFDARVRGQILHRLLELLHRHYLGRAIPEWPEEESHTVLRSLAGEVFDQLAWRSASAPRGVANVERERLCATLDRYLRIERGRGEIDWKPAHLEVTFGDARAGDDSTGRAEPYLLQLSDGETVRFAGRIDRIDCSETAARIIDYKTSLPSPDFKTGRSMQLAVYAMALEQFLMPGTVCGEAYFLAVGRGTRREAMNRKKDEWEERRAAVLAMIAHCIAGIREGRFPPTPADPKKVCAYCAIRRACRFEAARIERKEATS